jgi:hypothetical protein
VDEELSFMLKLMECNECGLPILEGADKLTYVAGSFSFATCECNNGGAQNNPPATPPKAPHYRDRDFYDNSGQMPNFARENGRFGSSPLEDDYGDESDMPDETDFLS